MSGKKLEHLAIIMDGNRRWASSKGWPKLEGHRRGYQNFKKIAEACLDRGIKILTVFAFSTENWNRSKREVSYLFRLLEDALSKELDQFNRNKIRLKVIGRINQLPVNLQRAIDRAERATADNRRGLLQLAINYGGQPEIVDAVKKIIEKGIKSNQVKPEMIAANLYNPEAPPPDLIIRTSGEQRLSGFLLWHSAYSEFYFTKKHWPEFNAQDLDKAIEEYNRRHRRFGGN